MKIKANVKIEDMSKDERSLLLYFETAAVDYGGKLDGRRMNDIDFNNAKQWDKAGFVRFGRIYSDDIKRLSTNVFDHWVVLLDDAWTEAHRERRARNVRVESKLTIHRNGYDKESEFDESYVLAGGDFESV